MWRKVAKVGAVKADRNRSRSERKAGVSCTCGLLVAWGPGRGATSRISPRREEAAIPHAYPSPRNVRNRNEVDLLLGLSEQPDAVARPMDLLVQHPDRGKRPLSPGTRIVDVYDEMDQE